MANVPPSHQPIDTMRLRNILADEYAAVGLSWTNYVSDRLRDSNYEPLESSLAFALRAMGRVVEIARSESAPTKRLHGPVDMFQNAHINPIHDDVESSRRDAEAVFGLDDRPV